MPEAETGLQIGLIADDKKLVAPLHEGLTIMRYKVVTGESKTLSRNRGLLDEFLQQNKFYALIWNIEPPIHTSANFARLAKDASRAHFIYSISTHRSDVDLLPSFVYPLIH